MKPITDEAVGTLFSGLRIALVGPVPPPAGGMASQTRQLAELLQAAGAEVVHVPTNAAYRPAWVASLRGVRAGCRLVGYVRALWRAAGECQLFHVMANSGWSWYLFAMPVLLVGSMRSLPVVVNYRGGAAESFLRRHHVFVRWSLSRAERLVVPSGFLREVFQRYGFQAHIVPNIVDLDRFRARASRTDSGARVLVARNLESLYDNATAIRAFASIRGQLPQARLVVAGSGPLADELRALAVELNLGESVSFIGRVDREAIAAQLQLADLTLNPSLADNMPNSVLESMASGVPVVSTNVGGVPYLLEEGRTGLMVPPADATAMAAAALRVLGDEALWQRLAQAAKAEVARYTWTRVAPLWNEVYRAAVNKSQPRDAA